MKNIGKASNLYPGRLDSDTVAALALAANTEQHFNIPTGATVAFISVTTVAYVLVNGQTAAVPTTSTTFPSPNTVAEQIPAGTTLVLAVTAGNLFSAVAPATCEMVISFFRDSDLS